MTDSGVTDRAKSRGTRRLPICPLGSVLLPSGVLPLHLFEPRYLALMDDLTGAELGTPLISPEFGVVGIERGHEVGGGEVRTRVGTVAHLVEAGKFLDGRWMALVAGVARFSVEEWLPDDPYPMATVSSIEDAEWDPGDQTMLDAVARTTRRVLQMAIEVGELTGPTEIEWSDDPSRAAWQVCAMAPVGPFDRQRLLEAGSVARRLELLADQLAGTEEMLAFRLGDR